MNTYSDAHYELASAYLDNEVTAAERAQVESAPEILALVGVLSRLAAAHASVPAAGHGARESAISAALAEFDSRKDTSNVLSLSDRRRWPVRVLSAAAAAVLLGVIGITVLNRGSSNDDASTASLATEPKLEASTADEAVGAAPAGDAETQIAFVEPVAVDDPQQLLSLSVVAESERLYSFNLDAMACMTADQTFLADIYYQGLPAIAVRDMVTGVTEAIDDNCTVLARVAP